MHPRLKKILKYTVRGVLFLLLLVVLATAGMYLYLKSDNGKKWLTGKIGSILEKETGTDVELGLVEFDLPNTLVLHQLRVRDHKGNIMFDIPRIYAEWGYYNMITGKITIGEAEIDSMDFHLVRYEGDSMSNFSYVLHRLGGSGGGGGSTDLLIKAVTLNNLDFTYHNQNEAYDSTMVDFEHIDIKDFNTRITYFEVDGPRIAGNVRSMSFTDHSGFELEDLRTRFTYTDTSMEFDDLYLRTPRTELRDYLRFDYKTVNNFNDFIDSVDMRANLVYSKASFKDIAFFTHTLQNKTDQVQISANVNGRVANMRISDLSLAFGEFSELQGEVDLKGLPNLEETFIAANVRQARTSRKELERIVPELALPVELNKFGHTAFSADFTGFINDFVAYGNFNTEIGRIQSDINLKLPDNKVNTSYSGTLKLDHFNLGAFAEEPLLGYVSMESSTIKGHGLDIDNIKANLKADISRFDFNGYSYHNLDVNGDIRGMLFNGLLTIKDTNVNLKFTGEIDFNRQKPEFDFTAEIGHANLYALNLAKDSLQLQTRVTFNTKGLDIDSLEGVIVASDTRFSTPQQVYNVDSLVMISLVDDHYREINLYSDFLLGQLKGDFKVSELPDLAKRVATQYLDSGYLHLESGEIRDQYVDFNIQFQDITPLTTLLQTDLQVQDSGYIRGSIDVGKSYLAIDSRLPAITYNKYHFNEVVVNGSSKGNELNVSATASSFIYGDTMLLRDINIEALSNNDRMAFKLYSADQLKEKEIWLNGMLDVEKGETYLQLDRSRLRVEDTTWTITAREITLYGDTLVAFPLVTFTNGAQSLKMLGKYGTKEDYPIRVILDNLDLPMLYAFVPDLEGFKGRLNGQVLLSQVSTTPIVEAAVFVNPLVYENDTLGILSTTSHYNQSTRRLQVDASMQNLNQDEMMTAVGSIDFARKQALDIDLYLNRTELKLFEPGLAEVFTDLEGYANAEMKVSGTLNEPVIKGKIAIRDAAFTIGYLNTRYHFNHTFTFDGKKININDLHLYDVNNHLALVDNSVFTINSLDDIRMDFKIEAYDYQVMNTTLKNNELFYGTAYGTGRVNISGPLDNLYFDIKMTTGRNTDISLPVSEGNTFYGHDYITFIDKNNYLKTSRNVKIRGIMLNMDLEVTPEAQAHLIFDPRVGDVIDARGKGNIRMDISTEGDFKMYGIYEITEGNYRFTAYDVINKNFVIKNGSTIRWTGSPYDADLDVNAAYVINNVSLAPLLPASVNPEDRRIAYPVEATLKLQGSLYSPDIKLGFDIKQLNTTTTTNSNLADIQNTLRIIKTDEQEVNKQVVSLLVLQQFAPVSSGIAANSAISSGLNTGVGDLVSNQINYWLSKISEDVQVGVDYRNQQDLTLRVNTVLFNQRVNVGGSYDVTNNNYNAQVGYQIKQDGSMQAKAFSRTNNNPLFGQNSSTIGVGISVRKEFETVGDLFKKKKNPSDNKAAPEGGSDEPNELQEEMNAVKDSFLDAIDRILRQNENL